MKKKLRISSFVLQGIYTVFCILDIMICLLYYFNFDHSLGRQCADFVLDLTGNLFLIAMPVGILLNLLARPPKQPDKTPRRRWILWTIISSCIYLIFGLAALLIFVVTTGGV
ncbi:MAG: hypothetical protein IJ468_02615 [Lachnospiraceae bacterium]|nr:hypothetical protein [Lachnospiraceae bacterium]